MHQFFERYSLLISFYLDGEIVTLHQQSGAIAQLRSQIARPMGIAVTSRGIFFACRDGLASCYPIKGERSQVFYRLQTIKNMGSLDAHELVSCQQELIFANTRWNCLAKAVEAADFAAFAVPSFTKELVPQDRAHLNGIALENGIPRYISCFAPVNEPQPKAWKNHPHQGCVWDLQHQRPVITDLCLPHSPRMIDDRLWVCESGKGRVLVREGDILREVFAPQAFTRGLVATPETIVVGTSVVRPQAVDSHLVSANLQDNRCGIHFLDRLSWKHQGSIFFADKREIFDVQVCRAGTFLLTAQHDFPVKIWQQ